MGTTYTQAMPCLRRIVWLLIFRYTHFDVWYICTYIHEHMHMLVCVYFHLLSEKLHRHSARARARTHTHTHHCNYTCTEHKCVLCDVCIYVLLACVLVSKCVIFFSWFLVRSSLVYGVSSWITRLQAAWTYPQIRCLFKLCLLVYEALSY